MNTVRRDHSISLNDRSKILNAAYTRPGGLDVVVVHTRLSS